MKIKQSMINLFIANIVTIGFAIFYQWDMFIVLWVYWIQSLIIGFFHAIKIFTAKRYTLEGATMNGGKLPNTKAGKGCVGIFFILHYGIFHLVYAFFLIFFYSFFSNEKIALSIIFSQVFFAAFLFFLEELMNFFRYKKETNQKIVSIAQMFFSPYKRIVPIHLFIILGLGFFRQTQIEGVVFFLFLKTIVDIFAEYKFQKNNKKYILNST